MLLQKEEFFFLLFASIQNNLSCSSTPSGEYHMFQPKSYHFLSLEFCCASLQNGSLFYVLQHRIATILTPHNRNHVYTTRRNNTHAISAV
jgi:hypothetical protein